MPNPGSIFLKAVLAVALSVLLFQVAEQVRTVEVTLLADGTMSRVEVSADDPAYRDEVDRAHKKAMPVYGLSVVSGLVGLAMIRKSFRVYRKTRGA
jgi:hypothetical protein